MALHLRRSSRSLREFAEILQYLGQHDVDAGLRFIDRYEETLNLIARFPDLGSPWESPEPRLDGVRVWPVKGFEKYLILYRRVTDGLLILHVIHGSRDIERVLREG
jgi:toxin ParE1/3/4